MNDPGGGKVLDRSRFALNRIAAPAYGLASFYDLAASLGFRKVELRNDLGGADPVDGLAPAEARRLAEARGIEVITINALQKFNLPAARAQADRDLDALLALARGIGCKAVVLCPNNDRADARPAPRRLDDTAAALAAYAPRFEAAGVLGYVEPLGFGISSLASIGAAREAIRRSGAGCYRILHDTFHHHIGPDANVTSGAPYDVSLLGLVHVSGVEDDLPREAYLDEHRLLAGPKDAMRSREQLRRLDALGYRGDFSFEPFSSRVQKLSRAELARGVEESLAYLTA